NLRFALFNHDRCAGAEDNPFDEEQLALVSLEFLLQDAKAADWLQASDWDMLIVDEAHHLAWHEEGASPEYRLVEQLAARIPAVLLLTATPEQLGQASHFARLRLLDPDRFHDLHACREETSRYQPVAEAVQRLLDTRQLADADRAALTAWLGDGAQALMAGLADDDEAVAEEARRAIIRQLLDRHGTGRVLYRNTRAVVSGFPERQLHAYPLPCPPQYQDIEGRAALYPEVGLQDEFEDRKSTRLNSS